MRVLVLGLLLSACTEHGQSPIIDAPPNLARCSRIPDELDQAVLDRGTCVTASDCEIIGGQLGFQTCDCAPFAIDCSGIAIAKNAIDLARAKSLVIEMRNACEGFSCSDFNGPACSCDCTPLGAPICSNGHCFAQPEGQCFPPPQPDAGVE